jgi:hypothetical protein
MGSLPLRWKLTGFCNEDKSGRFNLRWSESGMEYRVALLSVSVRSINRALLLLFFY